MMWHNPSSRGGRPKFPSLGRPCRFAEGLGQSAQAPRLIVAVDESGKKHHYPG